MPRWLGLATDSFAGGSTYDHLSPEPVTFVAPDQFVPVQTATVDKGLQTLDRKDEVRGVRGNAPIVSFASEPKLTFATRAYPVVVKRLLRAAMAGAVTSTGTSPAAITSSFSTIQSGSLPTLIAHVIREGQRDRLSGLAVANTEMTFAIDGEGTVAAECWGLYHEVDATPGSGLPVPTYAANIDTFKLRDAQAFFNDSPTHVPDLAGFSLKFDNGLFADFQSRFSANENVRAIVVGGVSNRLWYPSRTKIGPQEITGTLDFGLVKPDLELLEMLARAQKLVFQVSAGPAGTTPPVKEMLGITLYNMVLEGSAGADPLVREGDIRSSFSFTAYLAAATNVDVEVEYVSATALV